MTVKARTVQPMSILRYAATMGPLIIWPVGDTAAICASQTPTLNVPMTLNGLGVVSVPGSTTAAIMPVPIEPCFTPAVNTDVFALTFTGLDQYGQPISVTQSHASGVVTQRLGSVVGNRFFSRIDSIVMTSGAVSGAVTVGWKYAQTADGGVAANKTQRIPLPVPAPNQGDLIGVYVLDGGGGTFAAGNGQGAMLKSGLANFGTGPSAGALTYFNYGADPSALPTRPVTFVPVYAPGVNGGMSGNGGAI